MIDIKNKFNFLFQKIKNSNYLNEAKELNLGFLFSLFFTIFTSAIIVRYISVYDYGRYVLLAAVARYFTVLTLPGMNIVIRKSILKDNNKIYFLILKKIFSIVIIGSSILITIIYLFNFLNINNITFLNKVDWWIISMGIIILIPESLIRYEIYFNSKRMYSKAKYLKTSFSAMNFIFLSFSVILFQSLSILIYTKLIVSVVISFISNYYVFLDQKQFDNINSKEISKDFIQEGYKYNKLEIVGLISRLDRLIIGTIDPSLLALYHVASRFPELIKDNIKLFIYPIMNSWGKLKKDLHLTNLKKYFLHSIFIGLVTAIISFILSYVFIPIVFGENYIKSIHFALLLAIPFIALFSIMIVLDFDTVQLKGKFYRVVNIINILLYAILVLVLVPYYNIYGIIIATYISTIFRFLAVLQYLFKNRMRFVI